MCIECVYVFRMCFMCFVCVSPGNAQSGNNSAFLSMPIFVISKKNFHQIIYNNT